MIEIEGVSTQTWLDRFAREYERMGGTPPIPSYPSEPDPAFPDTTIKRGLVMKAARDHANRTMLDEIHLMLRKLCTLFGAT
jgi:hypothetical protein